MRSDLFTREGASEKGRRGAFRKRHPLPTWRDVYGRPPEGDPNRPIQRYDSLGRRIGRKEE